MIYLDNAATSYPKPAECLRRALDRYLQSGASPGRGGYDLAVAAEDTVTRVRGKLRSFFGADEASRVCFTYNSTDALNLLIQGFLKPGDHVVSSRLEHNSVLRPLHHLGRAGRITFDLVPFSAEGFIDPQHVADAIRANTKLVLVTHASNVLGTIQPVEEIGRICRGKGIALGLDVSQSAGLIPIRMKEWGVQGIAFTGHKSLLGPTGIGGLVLAPELDLEPIRFGGTGVDSASLYHSIEYPHRLEAGTLNLFGILALDECLEYLRRNAASSYAREVSLLNGLRKGLTERPRIRLYGCERPTDHLPVLTCTVDGCRPGDVAAILDGDFGICVRAGIHCAPLVHRDLGTGAGGAVRFSPGPFTTEADIEDAVKAMHRIAR